MAPKMNLKDKVEDGVLDLSMSDLQEVPVRDIASVKKAVQLDLSSNRLITLGKSFATLTHLVRLDLSSNMIKELPDNFGELKQLQHLDLYNNQIKHLPLQFSELKSLRWLDLKNNPLVPVLQQVAGPCLDAKQCQQCAKKVVEFLGQMQSKVDTEISKRSQQKQKEIEAQAAQKQQQKKNKKAAKSEKVPVKQVENHPAAKPKQTTDKPTPKSSKKARAQEKLQRKASNTRLKFLFLFSVIAGLVLPVFFSRNPAEYQLVKQQWTKYWNKTLEHLPVAVVDVVHQAVNYSKPAADFVITKSEIIVENLSKFQTTVQQSDHYKFIENHLADTWGVIVIKCNEVFRTISSSFN